MAKITLAQLDNKGVPTGHSQEFDEEHARRILSMPKPGWKETSGKKETQKPESK